MTDERLAQIETDATALHRGGPVAITATDAMALAREQAARVIALVAEVRRLRAEVERVTEACSWCGSPLDGPYCSGCHDYPGNCQCDRQGVGIAMTREEWDEHEAEHDAEIARLRAEVERVAAECDGGQWQRLCEIREARLLRYEADGPKDIAWWRRQLEDMTQNCQESDERAEAAERERDEARAREVALREALERIRTLDQAPILGERPEAIIARAALDANPEPALLREVRALRELEEACWSEGQALTVVRVMDALGAVREARK